MRIADPRPKGADCKSAPAAANLRTYPEEHGLNYSANLSSADAWKSVVHRYSKSLSSNLEFSKMSKTLTKSVSTKLTFVGVVYTTYDVSHNFTGENVAWGVLDTSIGILGIMSGYATIPSVLYFIGRTGNDVYQSSKPQEPLIFQSRGWQEYSDR